MNLKTDEITKVIQDQIKNYGAKTKQDEIGYVIQVGDGIAKVHGLDRWRRCGHGAEPGGGLRQCGYAGL